MSFFARRSSSALPFIGFFIGCSLQSGLAQTPAALPDAPLPVLSSSQLDSNTRSAPVESASTAAAAAFLSSFDRGENLSTSLVEDPQQSSASGGQNAGEPQRTPSRTGQQPKRILGLMPNYRSVSSGTIPPPPTLQQNFKIATRQAFDYSAFVFLGITSAAAYGQGSHPSLDTWNGGDAVFWAYLWRGFVDKTDGNYLAAFVLPTLLREDTRYYALGEGSKWKRLGYAASRVAIARTYHGRTTPNLAGIGGKIAAQAISPSYYPPGSSDFSVLATKFAYSVARDMGFTVFREFWPDIAIHALHRNP